MSQQVAVADSGVCCHRLAESEDKGCLSLNRVSLVLSPVILSTLPFVHPYCASALMHFSQDIDN